MARDSRPVRRQHAAHLFEMAAELHHHGGVGVGEAALQLGLGQRRRQHHEHVVALRDRRAGDDQQPDIAVTPGTISAR